MKAWSRSIVGRSSLYGPTCMTWAERPSRQRSKRSRSSASELPFLRLTSATASSKITGVTSSDTAMIARQPQFSGATFMSKASSSPVNQSASSGRTGIAGPSRLSRNLIV